MLGVLVAASAWVPTAAFGNRPPICVHVPDVRLVPEMIEEAGYDPNQPHGSVFAPIAGAEDEEGLLRVCRGALHGINEFIEGRFHERSARRQQVLEDDLVGADVVACHRFRQVVINQAPVDRQQPCGPYGDVKPVRLGEGNHLRRMIQWFARVDVLQTSAGET